MPYGTARPSSLIKKSCTRTSSGEPFGRHARPAFLKSPTSSFFLVSTEITGSPAASARVTCALMKANCASRSGCRPPSRVLALALQLVGEPAQALAGPAQRRFRIAARGRLDQGLESRPQLRIGLDRGLAARARPTQPAPRPRALVGQVLEPAPDGARRQAGDLSHCRDAAIAGGLRFGGGPQAAPPLVEKGLQRFVALPDAVAINHPDRGRPASGARESLPGHGGDQSPRRASGSRSVATKPQSIPQPEARSLPLNHSIRSFADGPLGLF